MIELKKFLVLLFACLLSSKVMESVASNSCLPISEKWNETEVQLAITCLDSKIKSIDKKEAVRDESKNTIVEKGGIEIEFRKAVVLNATPDKKNQFVRATFTVTNKNEKLLGVVLQGEPPSALDDNMNTFIVNKPAQIKHIAVCHNFVRDSAHRPLYQITNESKGEFCEKVITSKALIPTFLKYDSPQLLTLDFQPEAVVKAVKGDKFEFVKFNMYFKDGDDFSSITYTFENVDIQPKEI